MLDRSKRKPLNHPEFTAHGHSGQDVDLGAPFELSHFGGPETPTSVYEPPSHSPKHYNSVPSSNSPYSLQNYRKPIETVGGSIDSDVSNVFKRDYQNTQYSPPAGNRAVSEAGKMICLLRYL